MTQLVQEAPSQAPGSVIPFPKAPATQPDWQSLYGGLDGLDDRVSGPQKAALGQVDQTSQNPKEDRARAINQSYVLRQFQKGNPSITYDDVQNNWAAAKASFAKKMFGMDQKDIPDTALYSKIAEQFQPQEGKEGKADPWTILGVRVNPDIGYHDLAKSPLGQAVAKWHEKIGAMPLVDIPDAPVDKLPNIPIPNIIGPPITLKQAGMAWNLLKPQLESMESPEGLATLVGGVGLERAAAKEVPMAVKSLKTMSGVFSVVMAKAAEDGAVEIKRVMDDPNHTPMDVARAYANEAANVFGSLVGAFHTLHATSPEVAKATAKGDILDAPQAITEAANKTTDPAEKAALIGTAKEIQSKLPPEPPDVPPTRPQPEPLPQADKTVTEPQPKPDIDPRTFSIKNEAVEAELQKMDLPAPDHGEQLDFQDAWKWAQATIQEDPMAGAKLVSDLRESLRPATAREDALLAHEVTRLSRARDQASAELGEAIKSKDPAKVAQARIQDAAARDQYNLAADTFAKVGRLNSYGLLFRRMALKEDYSLAHMEKLLSDVAENGKITADLSDKVRDIHGRLTEAQKELDDYNAKRLRAKKSQMAGQIEDIQKKVLDRDTSKKEKPEPVMLDKHAQNLQAQLEWVRKEFEDLLSTEKNKNRSLFDKMTDTWVKWRRAEVLTYPITVPKLMLATAWRLASTPLEEGITSGLSKIPKVSEVAEKSPRYGGVNTRALAKAYTEAFSQGLKDAYQTYKTGRSELDILYGGKQEPGLGEGGITHEALEAPARLHAIIKSPLKRFAWTLSFEKRMDFNAAHGVDVSDPMVQMRMGVEAMKDAQRDLFLQNNITVSAYRAMVKTLEHKVSDMGEETLGGRVAGAALETAFPIVRVPVNIVGETLESATGLLTGSRDLGRVFKKGISELKPEQADVVMRQLAKGAIGSAVLYLGYQNYQNVGGFYTRGIKRKGEDVKPSQVRIAGIDVPKWAIEHPLWLTYQLGASIHRLENLKVKKSDKDAQGLGHAIWESLLGLIDETPFAEEGNLIVKLASGSPGEKQSMVGKAAGDILIPGIVRQIAEWTDRRDGKPVERNPKTIGENLKAGIPGLRKTVPERRPKIERNINHTNR